MHAQADRDYWEQRLGEDFDLDAVGYSGLGQAFNKWMYRARRSVLTRRLRSLTTRHPGLETLDMGSGTGFYVDLWRDLGAAVTGSDITQAAVDQLRRSRPDIEFERFDVAGEEVPSQLGQFDAISAFDVLFHITDDDRYQQAFFNIRSLLRPGGTLIFTDNFLHREKVCSPTQVSRTLEQIERVVAAAGLEVVDRRPALYLMNSPIDSSSPAMRAWWSVLSAAVSRSEALGWVAGAVLFPLEVLLSQRLREGPTTEMMVCRRPR